MNYPACDLSDCPKIFQDAVNVSLKNDNHARILSVQKWENTPYVESIENPKIVYVCFLESGNYYTVHKLVVSPDPENKPQVTTQGMTAGEIKELVTYSKLLQYSIGINQRISS